MRYAELADAGEKNERPDSDRRVVTGSAAGTDNARRTGKYPGTARILASRGKVLCLLAAACHQYDGGTRYEGEQANPGDG